MSVLRRGCPKSQELLATMGTKNFYRAHKDLKQTRLFFVCSV